MIWYYDGDLLGHNGGDPGTTTAMFYNTETGKGYVMLMNATEGEVAIAKELGVEDDDFAALGFALALCLQILI